MIPQTSTTGPVSVVRSLAPKPAKVSNTLEPEDVADLRAYAKEDGIYMPDHSTFAAALLRAELKSMGCTGCRQCGGNKTRTGRGFVLKDPDAPKKVKRKGFRKRKSAAAKQKPEPSQARLYKLALRDYRKHQVKVNGWMVATTPRQRDQLRQRGNEAYTRSEIAFFFPELPPLNLRLCTNCKGAGTIPRKSKARATKPLTARPTGSSKQPDEGGGSEMNEEGLHRRGRTDRRLAEVRKRLEASGEVEKYWVKPEHIADVGGGVLETYFAPSNETLKSLWPFTEYGKKLLDMPNPNGLTLRARITATLDAVHLSQDRDKLGWINLADREAQELLDLYVTTWNTIIAELVKRSSIDKVGAKLKVGATVLIFDEGKRAQGTIEAQAREFWCVRVSPKTVREVAGWHLERVS
jgi:hypothetical protein